MKWKIYILLFVFLAMVSGCDDQPAGQPQTKVPLSQTRAPTDGKAAAREVVDMAGRTVTLRSEINRIGTLGSVPMMNTFVESLGAGKKIYNQPSAFHNIHGRWKMHLKFAPQLAEGPHFQTASHELILENILKADPDVCVTNSRVILDMLDRFGVPVVFVDWSTVERMMGSVTMLGAVLGEEARAAAYVRYFQDTMARLRAIAETIPDAEKLTVLYSNPLQFRCPGSLTEEWLEAVGASSVTREFYLKGIGTYGIEDLLDWDPRVIFITHSNTSGELQTNPNFGSIDAVKNNRIIIVPTVGHMWGGHTVEAPVAACWIMHRLYPERMPKADLKKEIKYFYQTFFAYDMGEEEMDSIIAGGNHL